MITADLLSDLLKTTKERGVDAADVSCYEGESRSVQVRFGRPDEVTSSRRTWLLLRLLSSGRTASMTTSDVSRDSLRALVESTYAMLPFSEVDDKRGFADRQERGECAQDLMLFDPEIGSCTVRDQIDDARLMEDAAFGHDPRIKNSEGSINALSQGRIFYAATNGFYGEYEGTHAMRSISVIAKDPYGMQKGEWFSFRRHLSLLESSELVGKSAAEIAVRQLGARKIETCEAAVLFSPLVAGKFMVALAGAVSGYAIYRGTSFLCGRLDEMVASPFVTIRDDATIPRFSGSRPFDGEGARSRTTTVIGAGRLNSYLLDSYSARRLGLCTTAHAGGQSSIDPSNFFLAAGECSPRDILASTRRGLYVVELLGAGINLINGDFSEGARGIWIEDGELVYPVEEVTIAGNLREMLMDIEMVGNDLAFHTSYASPTFKVSRMVIAGK